MPTSLSLIAKAEATSARQHLIFPGVPILVIKGHEYLTCQHGLSIPYKLRDLCENTGSKPDKLHWDATQKPAVIIWDTSIGSSQLPAQVILPSGSENLQPAAFTLADNSFCILSSSLHGPELINSQGVTELRLQPVFELDYTARNFPAQIGELRLVESQRFLTLENQQSVILTQTDENQAAALASTAAHKPIEDEDFFTQIFPAVALNENKKLQADGRIHQRIFDEHKGVPVANVTVLEKYTSYFMQRYCHPIQPDTWQLGCWVPASPPVSWGWSIRVGKDTYGDWAIVRRKLMLPTVGHEGLQLPRWHSTVNRTADGNWQ